MKTETRNKLKQYLTYITTIVYVFVFIWALERGFRSGIIMFLIASLLIGLLRLAISWDTYLLLIDYGANIIKLYKGEGGNNGKNKKRK